jgi:hypothetical protein
MRGAAAPAVYGGELHKVIFDPKKPLKKDVATKTGAAPGTTNVLDMSTKLIAKLHSHLWALGFWVFPRANHDGVIEPEALDTFDWRTEWAVREFQIAAAMPNVLVESPPKPPANDQEEKKQKDEEASLGKRLSRLSQAPNGNKVNLEPTGVVTHETAEAIKYWLNKNYRCPLVIQATQEVTVLGPKQKGKRREKKLELQIVGENIWRWDEIPHSGRDMVAWDFSGYYDLPDRYADGNIPVGAFTFWKDYKGPVLPKPNQPPLMGHCWPEAELGPQSLIGKDWEAMSDPEKSNLRVICAVGEQECKGYLDAVNFYDNCHGSMGPCHWTMPMENTPKVDGKVVKVPASGELCGFMAFLEAKYPTAFAKHFAHFGIWGPRWGKAPPGAAAHGRPWIGTPETPGGFVYLLQGNHAFVEVPSDKVPGRGFAETYWLRGWPWVYRMEMATRTDPAIRKAMWDYAARRIAKIRAMTAVGDWVPEFVEPNGTKRKATLGDVLTSEQGIAVALRIHVRGSGLLTKVTGKKAVLRNALKVVLATDFFKGKDASGQPGKLLSPDKWKADHEIALVDAMIAEARKLGDVGGTSKLARDWPNRPPTRQETKERVEGKYPHTWYPDQKKLTEVKLQSARNSFQPLVET